MAALSSEEQVRRHAVVVGYSKGNPLPPQAQQAVLVDMAESGLYMAALRIINMQRGLLAEAHAALTEAPMSTRMYTVDTLVLRLSEELRK